MKKPLTYLSAILLGIGIWGAFLLPSVFASTIYQQLSDSSGSVALSSCTPVYVGSFVNNFSSAIVSTSTGLAVFTNTGSGSVDNPSILLNTQPAPYSGAATILEYKQVGSFPNDGNDYFLDLETASSYLPVTLNSGQVYYVYAGCATGGTVSVSFRMNLSNDFLYGYLTDSGGNSVPIAPGIVGFTDVGIATTSQQAYCSTNFATSSGLLDSLGRSISLGFCNVGVFLFVPSSQSISQWQLLASTSQTKIPFSYFSGFRSLFQSLTATTSEVVPTYQADLHSQGIGSTTPLGNILPSLTWLSTAAIQTYLPAGIHDALFLLARLAIWFSVAFMFYRRIIPKHAKV